MWTDWRSKCLDTKFPPFTLLREIKKVFKKRMKYLTFIFKRNYSFKRYEISVLVTYSIIKCNNVCFANIHFQMTKR